VKIVCQKIEQIKKPSIMWLTGSQRPFLK